MDTGTLANESVLPPAADAVMRARWLWGVPLTWSSLYFLLFESTLLLQSCRTMHIRKLFEGAIPFTQHFTHDPPHFRPLGEDSWVFTDLIVFVPDNELYVVGNKEV